MRCLFSFCQRWFQEGAGRNKITSRSASPTLIRDLQCKDRFAYDFTPTIGYVASHRPHKQSPLLWTPLLQTVASA